MAVISDRYFKDFIKNKKKATFHLLNKEVVEGKILNVGRFCLVVEIQGRPILLFKHAIHYMELPKTWTYTLEQQKAKIGGD